MEMQSVSPVETAVSEVYSSCADRSRVTLHSCRDRPFRLPVYNNIHLSKQF